jgi:hypothetical protein
MLENNIDDAGILLQNKQTFFERGITATKPPAPVHGTMNNDSLPLMT